LASQCPDLSKYLIAQSPTRSTIDFRDPAAVRSLNRALLKAFFGLTVHLPSDSLCPSVPNRLNYVQWIAENITAEFAHSPIWGVDIGTGASCVYPLLGVRVMPQCRFVATDINECSIQAAKQNVESNGLDARIRVYLNKNRETKLPLDDPEFPLPALADGQGAGQETVAFCMCNPPFYESEEERKRLGDMKAGAPSLQTGGKNDELYTEGGEAGFLKGLLAESKVLRERVRWYTTMVGKKSTLAVLKAELNAMGVARTKEGKLLQGRTTRWVIAWSF
ncbi:S-adenosyl-L-methionine dependent methyltransferase, partial [Martensiomyces pterosporus]